MFIYPAASPFHCPLAEQGFFPNYIFLRQPTLLSMKTNARFNLAHWQVHETEEDCDLIIRSTSGYVFYCQIRPTQFIRSPVIKKQYLKCLQILRSGAVEIDGFYDEDAYDWLFQSFEPLITQLVPSSDLYI